MRRRDPLDQASADLDALTRTITTGTADRPRRTRIIDLALDRMLEWAASTPPANALGPRGGSSSPREIADRAEDDALGRHAIADHETALRLVRTITTSTTALYQLATRYTAPIDHSKLPTPETTIPGCVSCARAKRTGPVTIGGFFAPVAARYAARSLCRWCGDYERATGTLPPIDAIDCYHRQGPQAAGRMLAKHRASHPPTTTASTAARICRTPIVVDGQHGICTRPFMHEGRCAIEAPREIPTREDRRQPR